LENTFRLIEHQKAGNVGIVRKYFVQFQNLKNTRIITMNRSRSVVVTAEKCVDEKLICNTTSQQIIQKMGSYAVICVVDI
jgi:hypothetical protein